MFRRSQKVSEKLSEHLWTKKYRSSKGKKQNKNNNLPAHCHIKKSPAEK